MSRLHQNFFATNLTTSTSAGATTSPLNSIPTIAAPFYIAFDATNINGHYEVLDCTSKTATNVNHAATTYDHTTAEEVRMVVPAVELDAWSAKTSAGDNGWVPVSDTWAYASAVTITVPSGAASLYQKGDKIKLTQTTVKYFYIVSVADTVLTITGGSDYTLANAAITLPYYSHVENPLGFPSWFNYTPVYTGFSANPTSVMAMFNLTGKQCTIAFQTDNGGTSNSNLFRVSTPITAATFPNSGRVYGTSMSIDNGTGVTTNGITIIDSGGNDVNLFKDCNEGVWTASGTKRAKFTIIYPI